MKTESNPLSRSTSVTIFPTATLTRLASSCPFQIIVLPQMSPIDVFQPDTAQGKLNAEMIPTLPTGFHYSRIMCSGRSLGITFPAIVLDKPTAMSQISMYSCTSPSPSVLILPTSSEIRDPSAHFLALSSSPIYRMTSPRIGMGVLLHLLYSSFIASMH